MIITFALLAVLALLVASAILLVCSLIKTAGKSQPTNNYPTAKEVADANDNQLVYWVRSLPIASTPAELDIMDALVRRYIDLNASRLHQAPELIIHDDGDISLQPSEPLITEQHGQY